MGLFFGPPLMLNIMTRRSPAGSQKKKEQFSRLMERRNIYLEAA
jgi:ribosomal protein S10